MASTQEKSANSDNYYEAHGNDYLEQRAAARSDHVQAIRASMFQDIEADSILDFGCGTGGILSNLSAKRKVGVEIGAEAAQIARSRGIEVYSSLSDVPSVDAAISFHALEHVDDDVAAMEGIFRVLRPGGQVRIVVPGELPYGRQSGWYENADKHLRTWTPLTLGNLAERAGFKNIRARFQPRASGSRGARLLGKPYRYFISLRENAFDVVLDARK